LKLRWKESEENLCRFLAVEARAAHDRFGLTHTTMLRSRAQGFKLNTDD